MGKRSRMIKLRRDLLMSQRSADAQRAEVERLEDADLCLDVDCDWTCGKWHFWDS